MKPIYLDFEYRNPRNRDMDILCCAIKINEEEPLVYDLTSETKREEFADLINDLSKDHCFVSYSIEAEARCIFQLFDEFEIDYKKRLAAGSFKFVDLMLEYRMLLNHNHELAYGKQLINGKEKKTKPPKRKWEVSTEWDKKDAQSNKPEYNLAAACYKMLGVLIDTKEKNEVRDLIISNKPLTSDEFDRVQSYCLSDIHYLPELHRKISNYLFRKIGATKDQIEAIRKEVYSRGEYAARTAIMARTGYPYSHYKLKKFSSQVPQIINREIEFINESYPDVKAFQWNKKSQSYIRKEKPVRDWIAANHKDLDSWLKTDKGALSLSLDAFGDHYSSSDKSFGGAYRNFLKTKQELNGFLPVRPGQKKKSFWDTAGDDHRARPYYGLYGSQSARSQPSSTGFIPLKANWMRAFIQPISSKAICIIDYSSQEFLLSALLSKDEEMLRAYESGDPYLYFAKLDGAIPHDGTKETHPLERDIYKTVTLGIGYLMGSRSLAIRLSKQLGRHYTEDEAQELINKFNEAFFEFHDWQNEIIEEYMEQGKYAKLKLPCGWYMFGDNKNPKSVGNFPMQGTGSSIMRKAVSLAQDRGLDVIYTLHDALAVEYPSQCIDYTVENLKECMDQAFKFYFENPYKQRANCRMDVFCWSPDYKNYKHAEYPTSHFYLDKKGFEGYKKFKEFLDF